MVWMLILHVLCMSRIKWWQGMRGQTTHVLLLMCYIACNVIHVCIAYVQLESVLKNFSSYFIYTFVNVKFKLSCTISEFIVYNSKNIYYGKQTECHWKHVACQAK